MIEEEAYLFKMSRNFCLVYWNWICAIIIHKVKDEYGVLFVKICEVNGGNTHVTCQFWYVAGQVLYTWATFHIFMPWFIYYLCRVLDIYVNFDTCCMTIHMLGLHQDFHFVVVLFYLIYVVSTQIYVASTQKIYVASRFVSGSTFSITPYCEELSSPAVACGPTYPTWSEITRHNNSQWCCLLESL